MFRSLYLEIRHQDRPHHHRHENAMTRLRHRRPTVAPSDPHSFKICSGLLIARKAIVAFGVVVR